ncbi:type I-E CRISPR-associated endoribonuclease Cas2 [Meiothermus sp. QL-1]|uniref:type I-E CRISPR-associated endoribonuclease Cas2e n=1 Tax=Meiothermus sp. QL-1 TaxID=2058095 RepID=UPI000E0ACB34|nr:type I-E CRISPR-associated endoribonuclease Cas2e [Meiothermus sp. QL-1]RDI95466.1 type I-E CRISPR-associated endoribonuclease Cas2 [Meiothermus sp. QL-1]
MVVMILEKVPKSLRGELTRWLLEVDTGVFVGRLSATVRELLWEKVVQKAGEGRCAMVWRTNNEQGFSLKLHNHPDRTLQDFDGIVLVTVRNAEAMQKAEKLKRMSKALRGDLDKKTPD